MKYYDNIHWDYDDKGLGETLEELWNDFEPQEYKIISILRLEGYIDRQNFFTIILELEKPLKLIGFA